MISVSKAEDIVEIKKPQERLITSKPDLVVLSALPNVEEAAIDIGAVQPNVVIMDINMPGMNGIDCIRKIADDCPKTQLMIFTIYGIDEKIFEALALGTSGCMQKKTPADKMIEDIKELQDGGSPMSSMLSRKIMAHFKTNKSTVQKILTNKENEILPLLAKGFLYKEITVQLGIITGPSKQYIHKIYEKLNVSNRTEAINKF